MEYIIDEKTEELLVGPKELIEVLRIFFVESEEAVNTCRKQYEDAKWDDLASNFLSLYGCAANLRIDHIAQLAQKGEESALNKRHKAVENILNSISQDLEELKNKLKI